MHISPPTQSAKTLHLGVQYMQMCTSIHNCTSHPSWQDLQPYDHLQLQSELHLVIWLHHAFEHCLWYFHQKQIVQAFEAGLHHQDL